MKHVKKTALLVLMITALMPVLAFGAGTGTFLPACMLSGETFDITGTVVSFEKGSGLVVSTENGELTVYGLGPERYWDKVDYPDDGENIQVTGYICPSSGRYIAFSVTVEGVTLQLRDPVTGRPLWRRGAAGRGW